jgi:hypothetical protein
MIDRRWYFVKADAGIEKAPNWLLQEMWYLGDSRSGQMPGDAVRLFEHDGPETFDLQSHAIDWTLTEQRWKHEEEGTISDGPMD